LQTIENASWAIGPILGGVLTAAAGPHAAYWINAVSFLVSAGLVARIPARLLQSTTALTRGHWTDLKDGFSAVLHSRPLLAVLLGWGLASLAGGAISVSEVFMAKNTLHAGDFGYGLLYAGIGTGLVLGSFWSGSLVERNGIARVYGSGLALMALGYQIVAVAFASYLTWFWLLARYPAAELSAFSFFTPLFGMLAGGLILGERIGPALALAMALVAAGLYLVNRPARAIPEASAR